MTSAASLLVNGAAGWHTGNQTLTYSFLGTSMPSYYPVSNGEWVVLDDYYDPVTLPTWTSSFSLDANDRALAELSVQAWNDVANINLVPGSISSGGGGSSGTPVYGNGTLVGGLGGATGYGETPIPTNDDGYTSIDLSPVFENGLNFFGTTGSSVYVNTNGSISFDYGITTYTPTSITGGSTPMIAPFWADVDTRSGQPIYVDLDTVNDVVTFTWSDVGYYDRHTDLLNSFQLQLYDRGGGDFDIVFRYEDINWTTGDASDGVGGLGGSVAHAGYSAGNAADFFELPQSGNQSAVLGLENAIGNTGQQGLWVFEVRNGSVGVGDITFGQGSFDDTGLYGFASDFPGVPGYASNNGDIWFNYNNSAQTAASWGNDGWQTFIHELGHGFGLHHPDEDPNNTAEDPTNNNQFTVMSYAPHPDYEDGNYAWPVTPMLYDIQAIQQLYGANFDTRSGNTTYFGTNGAYALEDGGNLSGTNYTAILTIWDGGGYDTIDMTNQTSSVLINLTPGAFSTVGPVSNNIAMAYAVTNNGVVANYIEQVLGGSAGDQLYGNAGDNSMYGNGGGDYIDAGGGNDVVSGGSGGDYLIGGGDYDTLNYWESSQGVIIDLGNNTASGGDAQGDTIYGFENVWGSDGGNDYLYGSDGANFLLGGLGDDVISGGASGDTLMGEGGWDTLDYWNAAGGVGVNLSNNTAWGGDAQNDIISGFEAIWGSNGGSDDLYGDDGANFILGGGGNDAIGGGGGGDTLMGEGGWDTLNYWNSVGGVGVNLSNNTAWGGDAQGDVISGFEAIWGSNGGSDDLYGDDGANFILGGLGNDAIGGGGGGDTLMGEGGWDTLNYWNSVGGVGVNLSNNAAWGGDAQGDVISGFEAIWGSNGGSDDLYGDDGANFILGGLGDDAIGGGGGGDTLMGDGGWDTLNYWNSAGGVGVNLSNNTAWGGDAQGDVISGFEAIWGSNGGNDWLFGSNGSNFIEAGEGNDALGGGAGSDTLSGGGGYDTAEFAGLQSDYTIYDFGGGEWQIVHNATGDLDILHSIEELVFHSDWGYA